MKHDMLGLVLIIFIVLSLISAIYGATKNAISWIAAAVIAIDIVLIIYVTVFMLGG